MRRLLAATFAALLLAALPGTALAFSPDAMEDVGEWKYEGSPYYWAKQDIDDAIFWDIFQGVVEGTYTFEWNGKTYTKLTLPWFYPGRNITRGEYATILARVLGIDGYKGPKAPFEDMKADDWFAPYVGALVEKGIIRPEERVNRDLGIPLLQGNGWILRREIAVWTARAAKTAELTAPEKAVTFTDVPETDRDYQGIRDAVALGIVKGYEDGTFRPDERATRAEAAAMIMRLVRQLTANPPGVDELRRAMQGALDAIGNFAKKYRVPPIGEGPEDPVFVQEFGEWFTAPNLQWHGDPLNRGEEFWKDRDRTLSILYRGGVDLPTGFANIRANDPMFAYGKGRVIDINPIWLGSRWAKAEVTVITHSQFVDGANLPDIKAKDTFYFKHEGGKWKLSGLNPIGILERGYDLK